MTSSAPSTPLQASSQALPGPAHPGALRRFWILYKKEARAYFNTPTAYIVLTVFLLITGYFFAQPLFLINLASLGSMLDMTPLLLVFFVPAVTMRLVAEELKTGTVEILSTLPVEDLEVMLAKYAAAMTVIAAALAGTASYPITLAWLGNLDWGATVGAYAGLLLTSAVLAAGGLLASTLTRNQIVAFILGFMIAFVFYLLGKLRTFMPLSIAPVTEFLGLDSHLENMAKGIFDSRDLLYYVSASGYLLYLAFLNLNSRRWN